MKNDDGNQIKGLLGLNQCKECLCHRGKATPSYLTVRARAALVMPWDCVLGLLLVKSSIDLSIDLALSTGLPLTESTTSNLLLKGVAHIQGK